MLAKWRRFQRKDLNKTGPAVKKRLLSMPQSKQLARAAFAKGKRNRAISLDCEMGESKGE